MKRVAGLSLNDDGWGLVEVGSGGEIVRSSSGTWRSPDAGGRGMELRRIWLEHSMPHRVMIAVPIVGSVWTKLVLPPVPDGDIASTIRASLTEFQVHPNDWLAYELLERGAKLTLRVAAVAAYEMASWVELVEEADIEPEGFILQAQAISKVMSDQPQPTAFLFSSETILEMGVSVDGVPSLLRSIHRQPGGSEEICGELSFTRHALVREGLQEPSEILLLGKDVGLTPDNLEGVWGTARTRISAGPEVFNRDMSLIAAYGAAQLRGALMVWHPALSSVERRGRNQAKLMAISSLILLAVGIFGFYQAHVHFIEAQNRWIKSNLPLYRELASIEVGDERLMSRLKTEQSLWERRFYYSRYLAQWQKTAPAGTVLLDWRMEGVRGVEITGRTPSIALLLERLVKGGLFKKLALKGAVEHNSNGWDEFRLSGELVEGAGSRK